MSAWGSPPKKKESPDKTNYVAKAQNWEQRIKSEKEAADAWYPMWGSVYASQDQAPNNQIRMQQLRNEITALSSSIGGMGKENTINYRAPKKAADDDDDYGIKCESLNRSSGSTSSTRFGNRMTHMTTTQASYGTNHHPTPYQDHLGNRFHRKSSMKTMGEGTVDFDELEALERMEEGRKY